MVCLAASVFVLSVSLCMVALLACETLIIIILCDQNLTFISHAGERERVDNKDTQDVILSRAQHPKKMLMLSLIKLISYST